MNHHFLVGFVCILGLPFALWNCITDAPPCNQYECNREKVELHYEQRHKPVPCDVVLQIQFISREDVRKDYPQCLKAWDE